jgi:hypothetical protein
MNPCASGCTIRGHHVTACEDRETCKGCLPRPGEFGRLCAWCFQRLTGDVVDAPGLVRHLRLLAEPHAGTRPAGDGRGHIDPAHGSILSGAVDAADEVHACLASWVLLILEEHPNGAAMTGPDERGAWLTQYGSVVGVRDPEATARLVRWLLPQLAWCAEQEWAGEMRREVGSLIRTTLARWPMEDVRTLRIRDLQCTACGHTSLMYTPTAGFELPFHVSCTHPECGRMYTEDEYDGAIGKLAIARGYVA